ncbi:acetate--CoA ligase family protein, partial [Myxococcota bacterium]|nr:acetate--CoA ligase family protein [Myxococcota bacterium]
KTDHGGVDLNIHKDDLAASISEMRERFEGQAVLVEEMAKFQGTEFIIGAMVDPEFGPAVMVGAGGILTELYKDVSFRLAPCSKTEAGRMIKELSVGPLFEGFRGINLDSDGLAEVISKAGELALALGDHFSQLDINPLVVSDGKWCALDAKLVLNEEKN